MGHTVASQRIVCDMVLNELKGFAKALKEEDREEYLKMLKVPMKHYGSISYTNSMHVWAFMLMTIILEQEKRIKELENKI
jgi:hypothetical protein